MSLSSESADVVMFDTYTHWHSRNTAGCGSRLTRLMQQHHATAGLSSPAGKGPTAGNGRELEGDSTGQNSQFSYLRHQYLPSSVKPATDLSELKGNGSALAFDMPIFAAFDTSVVDLSFDLQVGPSAVSADDASVTSCSDYESFVEPEEDKKDEETFLPVGKASKESVELDKALPFEKTSVGPASILGIAREQAKMTPQTSTAELPSSLAPALPVRRAPPTPTELFFEQRPGPTARWSLPANVSNSKYEAYRPAPKPPYPIHTTLASSHRLRGLAKSEVSLPTVTEEELVATIRRKPLYRNLDYQPYRPVSMIETSTQLPAVRMAKPNPPYPISEMVIPPPTPSTEAGSTRNPADSPYAGSQVTDRISGLRVTNPDVFPPTPSTCAEGSATNHSEEELLDTSTQPAGAAKSPIPVKRPESVHSSPISFVESSKAPKRMSTSQVTVLDSPEMEVTNFPPHPAPLPIGDSALPHLELFTSECQHMPAARIGPWLQCYYPLHRFFGLTNARSYLREESPEAGHRSEGSDSDATQLKKLEALRRAYDPRKIGEKSGAKFEVLKGIHDMLTLRIQRAETELKLSGGFLPSTVALCERLAPRDGVQELTLQNIAHSYKRNTPRSFVTWLYDTNPCPSYPSAADQNRYYTATNPHNNPATQTAVNKMKAVTDALEVLDTHPLATTANEPEAEQARAVNRTIEQILKGELQMLQRERDEAAQFGGKSKVKSEDEVRKADDQGRGGPRIARGFRKVGKRTAGMGKLVGRRMSEFHEECARVW